VRWNVVDIFAPGMEACLITPMKHGLTPFLLV
jgi:hypothetical protein